MGLLIPGCNRRVSLRWPAVSQKVLPIQVVDCLAMSFR
jgi:hypothetical protein